MSNRKKIYLALIVGILAVPACTFWNRDSNCPPLDVPDTVNLLPLPSSTDIETKKAVIYDPIFLDDGTKRPKGDKYQPEDKHDFRFVDLDDVIWKDTRVQFGDFRGVTMRTANCNNSDFRYSDFRFADLRWSHFNDSKLSETNFAQANMFRVQLNDTDASHSDFRGCNLFGLKGHRANLRHCDFSNSLMKESEITGADFSHSKAIKVIFLISVFSESRFDSTDMCYSDFTGAGLEDASFVRARLWGASFRGAHLQYADFSHADLKDCNFFGAELAETNFTDACNIPDYLKAMIVDGYATGIVFHQDNPE